MNRSLTCTIVSLLMLAVGCQANHGSAAPAPTVAYLDLLQRGIQSSRAQMPVIAHCAQSAAERIVAGGRIFVGGSQPDFSSELLGRAGGLMGMKPVPDNIELITRKDVILLGVRSAITQNDRLNISRWHDAGAYVIAFASREQSTQDFFPPDALIDSGDIPGLPVSMSEICPTDTVINIINAWTWTGEFISACTRLGKMPVVYLSYGLQGGHERAARYAGKMFHDDLNVPPIGAGVLGDAYLDQIDRYISAVRGEGVTAFKSAGAWLAHAGKSRSTLQGMAHIFPSHFDDPRALQMFEKADSMVIAGHEKQADMVLALAYQLPPQPAIDAALLHHSKLVYTSVRRAKNDGSPDIIYIDPHWPIEDACVPIKGYDIPALPASAVMQAAIYWPIIAETCAVEEGGTLKTPEVKP